MDKIPLPSISETGVPPSSPKASNESQDGNVIKIDDENNEEEEQHEPNLAIENSPLWSRDGWSLTWPIWHLLPLQERKQLAHDHGYKSIGAFEEYMSLHQAMDDSESTGTSKRITNASIPTKLNKKQDSATNETKVEDDDDDDDASDSDEANYDRQKSADAIAAAATEDLSYEELLEVGGQILMLHDEILHQVFAWLPVDAYATLALVSPHWKHLSRTEAVYRRLCERLYLNQSKKRQLHVSKFGGSYRSMLEHRPRVRAAGGVYVLKYAQVKQIQRDMWTEVPVGAILESVYYRYLYFQEDGRVLYALTSAAPHEMFRRLLRVCLKKHYEDKAAVWGTYQVQKNSLTITARQAWHTIKFDLTIEPESSYGRFGELTLNRHLSSTSGCFEEWSQDRVEYKVPLEHFRFVKSSFL